jgi:TfoX/Sxy family transcriptional regulator of competence genes
MATRQHIVDFLMEQMSGVADVSARKMFGEFAIYSTGKVVALVCDDQLFIKPTDAGRRFVGTVTEAPPYPGAKPCFLVEGDQWDDGDWLSELIRLTASALPPPKQKSAPTAAALSISRARMPAAAAAKTRTSSESVSKPKAAASRKAASKPKAAASGKAASKPNATASRKAVSKHKAKFRRQSVRNSP